MNWGHSLLGFFILYISFLVFVVFQSRKVDHSLVMDNYYAHDLQYQQRYDQIYARGALKHDLEFVSERSSSLLTLDYGPEHGDIEMTLSFYRAMDKSMDRSTTYTLQADECCVQHSTERLQAGLWTVEVEWTEGNVSYYKKDQITL